MFHNQPISPEWIIEPMIALGFSEKDRDGICYGIACILIQFINTRNIEPYRGLLFGIVQLINQYGISQLNSIAKAAENHRLEITKTQEKLLLEEVRLAIFPYHEEITIEDIKTYDEKNLTHNAEYYTDILKNRVEKILSEEEKLIFKIQALFDILQFNFWPETKEGSLILNKDELAHEQDFQKTFPFTKIDFDNTVNEQVLVRRFTDLFNLGWLTSYLKTFETEFNAIDQLSSPISFLVTGTAHAVVIAFDPLTKNWKLAGQEFLTIPEGLPAEVTAQNILLSFTNHMNAETALSLQMIVNEADVGKLNQFSINLAQNTDWQYLSAQIKERSQLVGEHGETPLALAIRDGDLDYAFMATENVQWEQMPNCCNYLMIALEFNVKPLIEHLMQTPLVNKHDSDGTTPLISSIENSNFELTCELLLFGANPNLGNNEGKTPVHFAALKNDFLSLSKLCEYGANVNLVDSLGFTALHYALQNKNSSIPSVDLLLRYGAIYTFADPNGLDAFDYASHISARDAILLLINKFIADGSQYQIKPDTFFMLCMSANVSQDKISVFAALDYGVDFSSITQKRFNQLNFIPAMPDVWLRMVPSGLNPNLRDHNNNTLLHLACSFGAVDIVDYLIAKGTKVNPLNSNEDSPLVIAVRFGAIDCVRILLTHDAIINPSFGQSALATAIENNNLEIVKELAKAPHCLKEKINGETPLAIAKRLGHTQITDFIRDNIAAKQIGAEATQFGKKTNLRIQPTPKRPRPT